MAIRKKAKTKHNNNDRWLLTYSDLITLLMVFFVVLYSMSKADAAKFSSLSASLQRAFNTQVLEGLDPASVGGEGGQFENESPEDLEALKYGIGQGLSKTDEFAVIRSDIEEFAKTKGLVGKVLVRENRDGIVITLSGNLLFDSAKAELKPQAVVALEKVATIIKDRSNEIRVEGHTDNIPISTPLYPSNWELSTARAIAVAKYLTVVEGISADRIGAVGYGEYRPIVDNDSREHRALNRRVDVLIVYPNRGAEIAPPGQTVTSTSSIGR